MERAQFDSAIRSGYGQPGVARLFYEFMKSTTAYPDTVRYIDNLLAQPG